jgi:endonuclease-3
LRRESKEKKKERSRKILAKLRREYPRSTTALHYKSAHELLVATILSAQSTDRQINKITETLFEEYGSPGDFAVAPISKLQEDIKSSGFYRNKARSIKESSQDIVERFAGEVPDNMDDLLTLRGIGRKTANVVLGTYFGVPAIVVDTHMIRVSRRLELTGQKDPTKIEFDLMELLPKRSWTFFSHAVIRHGRAICNARNPKCDVCPIRNFCPFPSSQKSSSRKKSSSSGRSSPSKKSS